MLAIDKRNKRNSEILDKTRLVTYIHANLDYYFFEVTTLFQYKN